ncbi:MAG TPA: hypothetical protein VMZ28_22210 [Kofleriaceae bacterium]|nr:hypothetical protein [Kofleriaceae bacterium]
MFRRLVSIIPALIICLALSATALAGGKQLTPQQKSAATKAFKKRALAAGYSATNVRVKYAGPTGRDAEISVVGVGGMTGQQPDTLLATARGRVTIHEKPVNGRKVGTSIKGGRFQTIFTLAPPSSPIQ